MARDKGKYPPDAEANTSALEIQGAVSAQKQDRKPDEKDAKIEELTNLLKRVQADFENYKKRVEKEEDHEIKLGKALIIRKILPVLDSFEQALKQPDHDKKEGLTLIHKQIMAALEAEGLRPIKAQGEKLDPYRHECLCEECSDKDKGIIIEEIQKGYILDDFVIRHSLVRVSSGKKENNTTKKGDENDNIQKNT